MAICYWVGGTGTWDGTSILNWASSSGGTPATSFYPQAGDTAIFDANSGSGTVTFNNTASPMCATVNFASPNLTLNLASSFTISGTFTLTSGSLNTNNYSFSATTLTSSNSNTRSISFGSSTVSLSSFTITISTGLTFNAGTSQINFTGTTLSLSGNGKTFYNVSCTNASLTTITVSGSNTFNNFNVTSSIFQSITFSGSNTFNNLTIPGRTSIGCALIIFGGNQTISSTLTISQGTSAIYRSFVKSDIIGATRTLTCNTFASTGDLDFRDITIAGAAAPISGTRFGNGLGNSGINFPAAKTVYFRATTTANWGSVSWSATSGGTADVTQFPLAQDTAIFPAATYPASGTVVTINSQYNIGTLDLSLRTTNTMTLALGIIATSFYGDIKTGTGITYTGTSSTNLITFSGRTTQNITSSGQDFPRLISIDSPGGTVRLLDAFTSTDNAASSSIVNGTLNLNGYTATLYSNLSITGTNSRGITFGGATLNIGSFTGASTGNVWDATDPTNLTLDSTGTINLGAQSNSKTFIGGGYQFYPTVTTTANLTYQGLTITGSNKFITFNAATTSASPATGILFTGGTVNEFTNFIYNGDSYNRNSTPLKSTNTTQATLKKSGAWIIGPNSTNVVGNTGLTFSGGTAEVLDYLTISYINGVVSSSSNTSNFFMMF